MNMILPKTKYIYEKFLLKVSEIIIFLLLLKKKRKRNHSIKKKKKLLNKTYNKNYYQRAQRNFIKEKID